MSKPLIGVILGAILGAFDGLTAWFTPAVRDQLGSIVISSRVKEIMAGIPIGFFARKFQSLPIGILFGVIVGAILAVLTALMVGDHYFQIILPGTLVGLIVGFATQRYGHTPAA